MKKLLLTVFVVSLFSTFVYSAPPVPTPLPKPEYYTPSQIQNNAFNGVDAWVVVSSPAGGSWKIVESTSYVKGGYLDRILSVIESTSYVKGGYLDRILSVIESTSYVKGGYLDRILSVIESTSYVKGGYLDSVIESTSYVKGGYLDSVYSVLESSPYIRGGVLDSIINPVPISGTIALNVYNVWVTSGQMLTTPAEYENVTSSGTDGNITATDTQTINIAENVTRINLKYRNLVDTENRMTADISCRAGTLPFYDGDSASIAVEIPQPVKIILANISTSATVQYSIDTLK